MNKQKKRILWVPMLAAIGFTLAGMTAPDLARAGEHGCQGMKHHKFEQLAERLDLSKEQRMQLKKIHRAARPAMMELGDTMKDNRDALRELDPGDKAFLRKTSALAKEQGKLVSRMIEARAQQRAQTYDVLTPEQRQQARQMRAERHHARGGRNEGKHDGGPNDRHDRPHGWDGEG